MVIKMESQNNTYSEKSPKAGKIVAIVIAVCAVIAAAVFLIVNLSASPAEKTAKAFMDAFKGRNFNEMRHLSDFEDGDALDYSSVTVFDYKIKAVSAPDKTVDRLIVKRYDDDEEFQKDKGRWDTVASNKSKKYGIEYVVVEDSADRYELISTTPVIDEYKLILDVKYTTLSGKVMNSEASMTVRQEDINSDEYEVVGLYGIIH